MRIYGSLHIQYINDLVTKILNDLRRGVKIISVVAKYPEAAMVLKGLLNNKDLFIDEIDISSPESSGYYNEYLVAVTDDGKVSCSRLYDESNKRYLYYDSEMTYVFVDCSCETVEKCRVNDVTMVYYGFFNREYDEKTETQKETKDIKDILKHWKAVFAPSSHPSEMYYHFFYKLP